MGFETGDVLDVISELARTVKYQGLMLNERYLHHWFSHVLQEKHLSLVLSGDRQAILLHPEWPTYKAQTRLLYGRYRRQEGKYKPDENGTAGFIDFAIGDYHKPNIGIEFSLEYGWSHEEIVYDLLKLLDPKNPFRTSISLNIIFRHSKLVRGQSLKNLENRMNDASVDAIKRLDIQISDVSRETYFIVTEIDRNNDRQHWHYQKATGRFERTYL